MHGVLARVTVAPVVAGAIYLIGYAAGYPLAGILAGTPAGVAVAYHFGTNARKRLEFVQSLGDKVPLSPGNYPYSSTTDEIDEAYSRISARLNELEETYANEVRVLSRQSQLLDRMNDGIMRVDANGMVSYANVAAGALFRGRDPAGRSFIAVARDHELSDLVQLNLRTGEDQQHTFEIPGDISVFNAVITRLADSPPESLVVLRDITEVTRLQTLRRDFVANVSHDLRTPLSAIKIMTETLLELREDDPDSQRFLGKIDDEVNVMTALVNDLLDLASLEGGESRLNVRMINLHHIVEEVRERMDPIAIRHDVELLVSIDADIEPIEADPRRLNQVLVNLVNNAIVHTQAGGKVEIAAFQEGAQAVFEVRDTGVGIHPDDLPRVWERFFRADRARSGRGTGLGLAIVKHVVLAHGGTMSATSTVGRGSEFRVTFPVRQHRSRATTPSGI
jgi:two-component system, OmpR family, phosphate regulon sensor histidine kinase PhoR